MLVIDGLESHVKKVSIYFGGLLAEQTDGDIAESRVDEYTLWDLVEVSRDLTLF